MRTSLLLLLPLLLLLLGCPEEEYPALDEPETTQNISPILNENSETLAREIDDSDYEPLVKDDLSPKIPIKDGETLLRVINIDLDLDPQDEQILVLKDKDDISSLIRIAVLDYEGVIKNYRRTWEGKTSSANIRGFNITLSDLIGDHNIEIICSGVSLDNKQSLTVFRKTKKDIDTGIFYSRIFDFVANGTIEILESNRDVSYESGMRDGKSYPIIATIVNPDSENIMDLIKYTFFWDFPSKQYIKAKEEDILGEKLAEDKLSEIYNGTDDEFIDYISGPWYLNTDPSYILDVDAKSNQINFYTQDVQEVYNMKNAYKVFRNRLWIGGENELINYVENEIYIKLEDINVISVSIKEIDIQTRRKSPNELWTGRFYRYNTDLADIDQTGVYQEHPLLFGKYIGDTGAEIEFNGNKFKYISDDESYQGGISLFSTNVPIFNMRIMNASNISIENRVYRYEYEEYSLGNTVQRMLTLYPGIMGIVGFEQLDIPFERYQQIEIIEETESTEE